MSGMIYTNYRHKVLQHMDRIAAIDSDKPAAPVNVEIDLTNRCQLACTGCHFAYTHSRGPFTIAGARPWHADTGDVMDEGLAKSMISQFGSTGVRSITFTGGGEPTLHPQITLLAAAIKSQNIDLGMYTNAVHVNSEMAKTFGRTMKWVYVSLDAGSRVLQERQGNRRI